MEKLKSLGFEKCLDGKYRRVEIHDSINIVVDEENDCIFVHSEIEHQEIEILITTFKLSEFNDLKQWLKLTDG